MKILTCAAALIAAVFFFASPAHATLLEGKSLGLQHYFPDLSSPYNGGADGNYVVGPAVEVPHFDDGISLDISDTSLRFQFLMTNKFTPAEFNGMKISDVYDEIDAFTSVSINVLSNFVGFDASRITFDDNNIYLNFQNLVIFSTTVLSLDLNTASQVPEPGSIALLASGLLGSAFVRRKAIVRTCDFIPAFLPHFAMPGPAPATPDHRNWSDQR